MLQTNANPLKYFVGKEMIVIKLEHKEVMINTSHAENRMVPLWNPRLWFHILYPRGKFGGRNSVDFKHTFLISIS
jgi:hypothetical protein